MSLNMHQGIKVLLASGGTGGHIFPGVALVKEFMKRRDMRIECLMVTTAKPGDEYIMKKEHIPYRTLPIKGMHLAPSVRGIEDLYCFFLSFIYAWHIISLYSPDMIIGFGAYPSFPIVIIGKIRGILTLIQEQNLRPGKANQLLGKWADGIFTSFPESEKFFSAKKVMMVGNPVRSFPEEINKQESRCRWGLDQHLFTILVCGGSRGAHAVNMKTVETFRILKEKAVEFQVIHQTGAEDFALIAASYKNEAIKAVVKEFFDSMMELYSLADIVIARAGAGTIAELTALGMPAILIPYPFARDDHQRINAMAMMRENAALMLDEKGLTGKQLADTITELLHSPESLQAMGNASLRIGRPKAAESLCDKALLLLEEKRRKRHAS